MHVVLSFINGPSLLLIFLLYANEWRASKQLIIVDANMNGRRMISDMIVGIYGLWNDIQAEFMKYFHWLQY